MKKVLFVASVFGFLGSFERNDIKILQEQGYEVVCAANRSKELGAFGDVGQLDDLNITKHQIDFARSPFCKVNITAYKQLKKLISENEFELIHCHTPIGGMLTRFAARKARKKGTKVIYTAHGFHFYKGAPLLNWLLYYPVERFMAHYTDVLITINHEDYTLAKKKLKIKDTTYIPGVGVDTNKFFNIMVNKEKKRQELGISKDAIMLLSVGELNNNKNHEVIVRAIAKMNNPNIYYCVAGNGNLLEYLTQLADSLNISDKVKLLGYRTDIGELSKTADIFCLPSKREGLCVSLMEAMACGLPCVVSDIRGNRDLIMPDKGGYLFNLRQVNSIVSGIQKIVSNLVLRENMARFNIDYIRHFSSEAVIKEMKRIYQMND